MSNDTLKIGETWEIRGSVNDEYGDPISRSGVTVTAVALRILRRGQVLFDLSTPAHGTLTGDRYVFQITPTEQVAASVAQGTHTLAARATLSDGRETIQNEITVIVVPSSWSITPTA